MGCIRCVRCNKYRRDFVARTFALVRNVLPRVSQGNQMVANAPKQNKTDQNMSLGSNGVDRVRSLRNDSTQLRGTNFCTSSERFASSFIRQLNSPKCTQMVQNAPKHEFRVQWGGSGMFVAKNSDATSWHEHFATKAPDPPHWTLNSCFGAFRSIGCVRCEKFRQNFMARTFALV